MPKIKTNRSAAKRFKRTGSGKYVFAKSHGSHILTKKSTKRKRFIHHSSFIVMTWPSTQTGKAARSRAS